MNYACLSKRTFVSPPYSLIAIRREDMESIRRWRNAQIDILRQTRLLSQEDQENYWIKVLEPSFALKQPKQVLFTFLKDQQCIGYGGLTHIDWDVQRAEISFLLDPQHTGDANVYSNEFMHFLGLLKEAAFDVLGLHRLYTETFDTRPVHVATLEKAGFQFEGRLKDHVKVRGKHVDSLIHGFVRINEGF